MDGLLVCIPGFCVQALRERKTALYKQFLMKLYLNYFTIILQTAMGSSKYPDSTKLLSETAQEGNFVPPDCFSGEAGAAID